MEKEENTGGRLSLRRGVQVASSHEIMCVDNHFLYAFL